MVELRPRDPFPRYGLAMELKKRGELEAAAAVFEALVQDHGAYVPCYLMYGGLLRELGRTADAIAILDRGIAAAEAAGDGHAASELAAARAELS
ncbi:MAG TPA: tetratricopeptide repeat protein [Nannocystaceae bacterium]|nr:tetratricopeptide repeat protein [Nannocystaceae bacterium]